MTKTAGIEGTAILARDRRDMLLARIGAQRLREAEDLIGQVSVLREGIAAAALGVHAMHDATEGGILGAVWEMCTASGQGCLVQAEKIPVHPATAKAAQVFGIDPLRLIASGSMILATDRPDALIAGLAGDGIACTAIGIVEPGDCRMQCPDGNTELLTPPAADELYKTTPTSYY
jgi:hydrogenase maturation factor